MTFYIPKKALLMCATRLRPQDVFATSLYTGNGGTQTITNGLDLAGKGGLLWFKPRTGTYVHTLIDSSRGLNNGLFSNLTNAEQTFTNSVTSLNSNGFTVGADSGSWGTNISGVSLVNWSFRRAKKFFDTVTYTGNGVAGRQIPHGLGDVPGMIIIKARTGPGNWSVFHRSYTFSTGESLTGGELNSTNAFGTTVNDGIGLQARSASDFTVRGVAGSNPLRFNPNENGVQYVAYLFAHNPDLIDCGSYVGNGSTNGPSLTCGKGWTPQWLMLKRTNAADDWFIYDASRTPANPRNLTLLANSSAAETSNTAWNLDFTASGFQPKTSTSAVNGSGSSYVYLAIRAPT